MPTISLNDMTQERWNTLTEAQRVEARDYSCLSPQLRALEGWRIEVIDMNGEKRRFIVGQSTGWRPCHLELKNTRSHGGAPADREYKRVIPLERIH